MNHARPPLRIAALAALAVAGVAQGGHEFPVYPSFYPHEIRIDTVAPPAAAALFAANKLHAYLGPSPFVGAAPASVKAVDSLGALVVVRVNAKSPRAADAAATCALAASVVRAIGARDAPRDGAFRFHPYPVTPYDGDYLYYADRADAARARWMDASPAPAPPRVRVDDARLAVLVAPGWRTTGADYDVAIDAVDAASIVDAARVATNGWVAPPWLHASWFRTAELLHGQAADVQGGTDAAIDARIARLESGDYGGTTGRVREARALVDALASRCTAVVAGFTLRREYVNDDYSAGVENVAFDPVAGLASPVFLRTVKLKDFPWNGWLTLGIDTRPQAAWNPVAGFTDPFGRLLWATLGDPALLPLPGGAAWMLDRISDVR
jgi:hypothetical protein